MTENGHTGQRRIDGSAAPTDSEFALERIAYSESIRKRYRVVDHLAALTPRGGDAPRLPLGDIFIPQLVRADPPAVELPREVWQRLIDAGELSDNQLPRGLDRRQVERAFKVYAERPQRSVFDVFGGVAGCQKLVLLGYPGAGKSTFAKYLMLQLAAQLDANPAADGRPLENLDGHLPVLVELRTYAQHAKDDSFLDQIDQQYEDFGLGMPKRLLEPYLRQGGPRTSHLRRAGRSV